MEEREAQAGWAAPAASAGEPGPQGGQSVPSAMAASRGRLEVRLLHASDVPLPEQPMDLSDQACFCSIADAGHVLWPDSAASDGLLQLASHLREAWLKACSRFGLARCIGDCRVMLRGRVPA